MKAVPFAFLGAAVLGTGAAAAAPEAALPGTQFMRELARDRGCTTCHREAAPATKEDAALPTAPSWHDISARYRNAPGARERLTAVVLTGSDPNDRHWSGNAAFDRMMANEIATTPQEADQLVRWILSLR